MHYWCHWESTGYTSAWLFRSSWNQSMISSAFFTYDSSKPWVLRCFMHWLRLPQARIRFLRSSKRSGDVSFSLSRKMAARTTSLRDRPVSLAFKSTFLISSSVSLTFIISVRGGLTSWLALCLESADGFLFSISKRYK